MEKAESELERSNALLRGELTDARAQLAASAEVLKVISRSAFDLQIVLDTLTRSATALCQADMAGVCRRTDGAGFYYASSFGFPDDWLTYNRERRLDTGRGSVVGRVLLDGTLVHVPDVFADPEYTFLEPARKAGFRTFLGAPLMRDDRAIGVLVLARRSVAPFSTRQIELVQTFAAQAVIAIENARLFEEIEARNRALAESLEQQTASNEVLSVISTSPTDIQPVFDMIAERSARLCAAEFSAVFRYDGELIHFVAQHGLSDAGQGAMARIYPIPPGRSSTAARTVMSGKVEQIPDFKEDPDYAIGEVATAVNARAIAAVPMLRSGRAIGAIAVAASTPGLFPARQIALLQTFAGQAVIAIENARLFDEVQIRSREVSEALERQTATGEVLRVIAASPTDIQPVLKAVVASAATLCDAYDSLLLLRQDDFLVLAAHSGPIPIDFTRWPLARDWVAGRSVVDGRTIQVADLLSVGEDLAASRAMSERFGNRTILAVPLLREGEAIGAVVLRRIEARQFGEKQVELLQTFADQAAIAIQNVRMFEEVQARSAELREALAQQTATADVLKVISRSTFDLQAVLDELARSVTRLCDADNAAIAIRQESGECVELASFGASPAFDMKDFVYKPGRGTCVGRVLLEGRTIQIPDVLEDPEYTLLKERPELDFRTALGVPLLREGVVIGVFALTRSAPRGFSQKQIELVETFADQAVIAIENVRLFDEVQARNREVSEALEQQTATADILRVIAASPTDIQPVLQVVAESAARFCDTYDSVIFLMRDGLLVQHAHFGPIPVDVPPLPASRDWVTGRAVADREPVHLYDALTAEAEFPLSQSLAVRFGHRTMVATPLMRDEEAIGALVIRRVEVRPFTDKQINLLKTFADQAVIAIENVRLFEEVQARTRELSEALNQQTATADVLKVISRSTFDLPTVFGTLVQSAVKLCGASYGGIFMRQGDELRAQAMFGMSPSDVGSVMSRPIIPDRKTISGRVLLSGRVEHIPDVLADPEYDPLALLEFPDTRALMGVPLLREGKVDGVFVLDKPEPGAFTVRQAELVQTFADQAVIAIQNVRLFDEVQARTADLADALSQQTATADVLKVISRSAFDLQPVLDTLVESAARVCEADKGVIYRRDGELFRFASYFGFSSEFREYARQHPHQAGRETTAGRAVLEGRTIHIPDVLSDPEYRAAQYQQLGAYRTSLAAPLMREGVPIGVFVLTRSETKSFSARQIELVETFADQAVIAMENARLFDEVQARTAEVSEALEQQTATADVLKVISRSAFDLQTVLETLVQSVARLCNAGHGLVFRRHGDAYRFAAGYVLNPEFERMERELEVSPGRGTAIGRALLARQIVQIADALSDPDYEHGDLARAGNLRTVLAVPLLREGEPIGAFGLSRDRVELFTDREVELVRTFADQAVIAIENARLFEQVQAKTRDLEESLRDLRTAQDRLVQTEKLASLGQLTAGIAHEIKNPLNFVNNFASLSRDLLSELSEALDRTVAEAPARHEIDELMTMLRGNLAKVEQHGRRADSIVRNMLLHSRQGSGEHRLTNINAVVEESLNLAYHGARAETQGFNITLERDLDPAAGDVDLYPQEITRVLLNLISNGFYATSSRRAQTNGAYEPVLAASTKDLGDRVEIRIRDNGTGIPPEVKERMFNPFFTTKPAGEGTGLGLSLSHDIVVKQHAGTIEVSTQPGEFTEFRIVLPRGAASLGMLEANT